jgi:hypothetical protein
MGGVACFGAFFFLLWGSLSGRAFSGHAALYHIGRSARATGSAYMTLAVGLPVARPGADGHNGAMDDERDDAGTRVEVAAAPRAARELAARYASQQGAGDTWRDVAAPLLAALGWETAGARPLAGAQPGGVRLYRLWAGAEPGLYVAVGGTAAARALAVRRYTWSAGLPVGVTCAAEGVAVYSGAAAPGRDDGATRARCLAVGYGELAARWGEIVARCGPQAARPGAVAPWDGRRRPRPAAAILGDGRGTGGARCQGSGRGANPGPGGGGPVSGRPLIGSCRRPWRSGMAAARGPAPARELRRVGGLCRRRGLLDGMAAALEHPRAPYAWRRLPAETAGPGLRVGWPRGAGARRRASITRRLRGGRIGGPRRSGGCARGARRTDRPRAPARY